jgi:putative ABC transport system ATP-binding protein
MPSHILEADSLVKSYDGRPVLRGVSLSLEPGERLALMGPSGSGKTTLLNCLGGIDRADGGTVRLRGADLGALSANDLAGVRRRDIGSIFQFFHLLPTLTAAENVEFPLQLAGVAASERKSRVAALLERTGIAHRSGALPSELSGGEMQRVAISRALIHRPALLLADEPTGNLDSVSGAAVLGLLRGLSEECGTSLVLVTHSAEAAGICHRIIHLKDGVITAEERQA